MGVKLLEPRLCLLLLLPLVLMVSSVQVPRGLTPSQWFEIQHVNNRPGLQCTAAMRGVNNYTGHCKDKNTFLHTTFAAVVGVCGRPNTPCRNRTHTNCHNSPARVSLTYCNLTTPGAHYTQCRYQTSPATMFYRVACNNRTPQDNGTYPVVPVHLDGIF
ncbi:eosinophil cationic protein-like [Microtus pennsylvanicus]|uniref:eosinophil cationic protein-like n=1 Tax=Microtus pennsylvanicus TaxID=10058 RepID=UPI003F6D7AB7